MQGKYNMMMIMTMINKTRYAEVSCRVRPWLLPLSCWWDTVFWRPGVSMIMTMVMVVMIILGKLYLDTFASSIVAQKSS